MQLEFIISVSEVRDDQAENMVVASGPTGTVRAHGNSGDLQPAQPVEPVCSPLGPVCSPLGTVWSQWRG